MDFVLFAWRPTCKRSQEGQEKDQQRGSCPPTPLAHLFAEAFPLESTNHTVSNPLDWQLHQADWSKCSKWQDETFSFSFFRQINSQGNSSKKHNTSKNHDPKRQLKSLWIFWHCYQCILLKGPFLKNTWCHGCFWTFTCTRSCPSETIEILKDKPQEENSLYI